MSCKEFELAEIYDYSDGSLDSGRRLAFDAHITACADCRTALGDVRRISTDLERASPPVPEPSPGMRDFVFAGADVLLKRLREEGTAPARPSRGRSARIPGADSPHLPFSDPPRPPLYTRPIPRFVALAAAILIVATLIFLPDRELVASILDGDGVYVNDVEYKSGPIEIYPEYRIRTDAGRAGSFLSSSGASIVLGPSSELLVKGKDKDGCIVLSLESGRAWILLQEGSERPAGVDFESSAGEEASITSGQAFVVKAPGEQRFRIQVASCGGRGGAASPKCPQLEMAHLDEVVVQLVPNVSSKTADRARMHYDLVKPGPVHWVDRVDHAKTIAWSLRRPLLVVDDSGGLAEELFREDEALRKAASRYVCVRITRGTKEAEELLSQVEPPENRRYARFLLCPRTLFRCGFAADAPLSALVAEMEKVCEDVTEHWREQKW